MFDQTRPFTIWNLIAHFAENTPDALAIVAPGRNSLTYGSLQRLMRDVCYTFRSMGISQTDRVALILPSTPVAATAFISVAACSIAAPSNPGYTQSEWEFYLKDLRATPPDHHRRFRRTTSQGCTRAGNICSGVSLQS